MFDVITRGPQKLNEAIHLSRITGVDFAEGIAERLFCDGYLRDGDEVGRERGFS